MSQAGSDNRDSNTAHVWNRTPGKPNNGGLINSTSTTPWGGNNNNLGANMLSVCSSSVVDVWSNVPDSTSCRTVVNTALWPTPAEVVGTSRSDAIDFAMSNSWNSPPPGTALALRSAMSGSDEPTQSNSSSWPPSDKQQSATSHCSNLPRAITGQQSGVLPDTISDSSIFDSSTIKNKLTITMPSIADNRKLSNSQRNLLSAEDNPVHLENSSVLPSDPSIAVGMQKTIRNLSGDHASIYSTVFDTGSTNDINFENDAVTSALINTRDCWGRRPVDQSTPWDVSAVAPDENIPSYMPSLPESTCASPFNFSQPSSLLGDAVAMSLQQQQQQRCIKGILTKKPAGLLPGFSFESNVWPSEPPNGTGIWESHYESLGENPNRWKPATISPSATTSSPSHKRLHSSGINSPSDNLLASCRGAILSAAVGSNNNGILSNYASTCNNGPHIFDPQNQRPPGSTVGSILNYPGYQQRAHGRFGSPFPPNISRGGINGPNGMLGIPNVFTNQLQSSPTSALPPNWPMSSDSAGGRFDEISRNFPTSATHWRENSPHGRPIGKQIQSGQLNHFDNAPSSRWPSSSNENFAKLSLPSVWPAQDPRKLNVSGSGTWNQIPYSSSTVPPMNQINRQNNPPSFVMQRPDTIGFIPPRFHIDSSQNPHISRQHLPQHQPPPTNTSSLTLFRGYIVRSLFNLGFPEEAHSLLTSGGIDIERFLVELRDRTGHAGVNQLLIAVSNVLSDSLNQSEQSFDGFLDPMLTSPRDQLRANTYSAIGSPSSFNQSGGNSNAGKFVRSTGISSLVSPDFAYALQQREAMLIQNIRQLHAKYQDIVQKQGQLCKMNVGPTPSPLLQELKRQDIQITQQIEAHRTQLKQVRSQVWALSHAGIGQSGQPSPTLGSAFSSSFGPPDESRYFGSSRLPSQQHAPANMQSRQQQQQSRQMIQNQDLSSQLSDMKISQNPSQIEMRRQFAWETSAWNSDGLRGSGNLQNTTGQRISDNLDFGLSFDRVDDSLCSTTPLGGDRRWAPDTVTDPYWSQNQAENSNTFSNLLSSDSLSDSHSVSSVCWLLINDLSPHISVQTLKTAVSSALSSPSFTEGGKSIHLNPEFEIHPNLSSRYVLMSLGGCQEANAVSNMLTNNALSSGIKLGSTSIICHAEALEKLHEIKNLAVRVDEDRTNTSWIINPSGETS